MIRKLFYCSAILLSVLSVDAQQIKTPAPSPMQTIKQDFGITNIELSYSRPAMKGRKIFGELVPFGQLWRTGANSATTIKFADDVNVGGKMVKAGEYALFTIPGENEWEIILNKDEAKQGIFGYKESGDVARFKVKSFTVPMTLENLTMQFMDIKGGSVDLRIMWDKTGVTIPITMDVDTKVMAQINDAMNKDSRPYFQAAAYYLETGKDLNQAVTWFDKAIEQNANAYWIHHQKAIALSKLNKKAEAKAAAQKSMDIARQQNNMDYVRLNEKLIASLK